MAWKLTGSPYLLNTNMEVKHLTIYISIWNSFIPHIVPQDRLCKNPKRLDVYPCDESLTEVYFKPTYQRTLRCRNRVVIIIYLFVFLLLQVKSNQSPGPLKLAVILRVLINIIEKDFIMFNSESNVDSCAHTNCFFLSVERRVSSSLSAFISSSLYWKSRTTNLKKIE